MDEKFLTTDELCELFKVSRSTVERWRKAGMPYIKQGKLVRFDKEEVLKWFKEEEK